MPTVPTTPTTTEFGLFVRSVASPLFHEAVTVCRASGGNVFVNRKPRPAVALLEEARRSEKVTMSSCRVTRHRRDHEARPPPSSRGSRDPEGGSEVWRPLFHAGGVGFVPRRPAVEPVKAVAFHCCPPHRSFAEPHTPAGGSRMPSPSGPSHPDLIAIKRKLASSCRGEMMRFVGANRAPSQNRPSLS